MRPVESWPGSAVLTAMMCAGLVSAQFVAGKATRDALFLAHLDVTSLPAMIIATAGASILLVVITSSVLRRVSPGAFVPALFGVNALLLLGEWRFVSTAPVPAAIAVYLQISGLGPILGSGFWLITSERFDPRTAKQRFGQIGSIGTLGGLLGGLLAERMAATVPVTAMLPVLAAMNLAGAWQIRRLAGGSRSRAGAATFEMPDLSAGPARSGLSVLARAPYLRNLAAVVLLGTMGAALIDYLFKVQVIATFGRGEALLRFFAIYYAGISVVTFLLQASSSRLVLEKFGLGASAATPSAALLLGGLGGLIAPGLQGVMAARAGESVFRGSLFRSSYELFYTPILPSDKRAAKSVIDVGFDRLGDAVGGSVIRILLVLGPALQYTAILLAAISCSAGALILTRRLSRGYIQTLERSLLHRAVELDLSDVADMTTRSVMLQTLSGSLPLRASQAREPENLPASPYRNPPVLGGASTELTQIATLRSRDRDRILELFRTVERLPAGLVPYVIPLVAWDLIADEAMNALRKVAEERVGQLTDALIDPNEPFAVRRRIARVLAVCNSPRALEGLLYGLDDSRFEVRFQCGRSLAAIFEKSPRARIDRERVFEIVRKEVTVSRPVWESHQLLDRLEDQQSASFVDEFVKTRASRSLAHVFTLLSLVLPAEPLQIAFRGLHTDDQNLRGTALEYLEGVLPPDIRDRLWPFLEDSRPRAGAARPREEILEELLRSNRSIILNLEELKRRSNEVDA
jgi:AAA family ATP:ADP antiporter